MSMTARLPKWASLLLTLLIGAALTFGGQLFVAMAKNTTNNPPNIKMCTLDKGAPTNGQIKVKAGKDAGISEDLTQFHLTCVANKNK